MKSLYGKLVAILIIDLGIFIPDKFIVKSFRGIDEINISPVIFLVVSFVLQSIETILLLVMLIQLSQPCHPNVSRESEIDATNGSRPLAVDDTSGESAKRFFASLENDVCGLAAKDLAVDFFVNL